MSDIMQSTFAGYIETVEGRNVSGWAFNRDDPDGVGTILVSDGEEVIGILTAKNARTDVEKEYGFSGPCQFEYRLPDSWAGELENIVVYVGRASAFAELARLLERERHRISPQKVLIPRELLADPAKSHELARTTLGRHHLALGGIRPAKPLSDTCVLFDISDLIQFLRHYTTVTGIQRTVCGVIASLLKSEGLQSSRFAFCTISERSGYVRVLPDEDLYNLVKSVFDHNASVAEQENHVDSIVQSAAEYSPNDGQIVFILGAYWIISDVERKLQSLIENGVRIGIYAYDFIPFTHPHFFEMATGRSFVDKVSTALTLSSFVVTISEFTKLDGHRLISKELGGSKLIEVTPLPQEIIRPEKYVERYDRFEPAERYALCVSTIEPRKNHQLLYRVWAGLCRKYGRANVPTLVLVGRWGWLTKDLKKLCEDSQYLRGKIRVLQGVGDEELISLYKNCLFSVFPSFVEGWGLPVGESLSFGKPCVASSTSSIPEVGQNFVDYVDPYDYEDCFVKIERMMFDESYRIKREQEIALKFKPRGWMEYSVSLLEKIEDLGSKTLESKTELLPPLLKFGILYDLFDLAGDDTISWKDKLVRFALGADWHALDHGGAWSLRTQASIRFRTPLSSGTYVKIWLQLRLPNDYRGERLGVITDAGDVSLTGNEVGRHPRWVSVPTVVGNDGLITLLICRPYAYALVDAERDRFVGLSGIAYHELNDQSTELKLALEFATGSKHRRNSSECNPATPD